MPDAGAGRARRHVPLVSICGLLVSAWACTPFQMANEEFDAVARIEGADTWPEQVSYDRAPLRYPWAIRNLERIGFPVQRLLDVERVPYELENPSGFAREQVEIMVLRARRNLSRIAITARRLLWVAELDSVQPMNQAVALSGLAQLIEPLELDVFAVPLPDPGISTEAAIGEWLATLEAGWPPSRTEPLVDDELEAYLDALRSLTARPHPSTRGQRDLIGAMQRLWELETQPELIEPSREAFVAALAHGTAMGLRRGLFSASADVREAAVRALHLLGGPESVPAILRWIAKPASSASRGLNRYDESSHVRLALIHLCGQLGTERALTAHDGGPTPAEFLYETHFSDPEPGLRTVALEALARCLRREVSFDPDWAEAWWRDEYVPHRSSVGNR